MRESVPPTPKGRIQRRNLFSITRCVRCGHGGEHQYKVFISCSLAKLTIGVTPFFGILINSIRQFYSLETVITSALRKTVPFIELIYPFLIIFRTVSAGNSGSGRLSTILQ